MISTSRRDRVERLRELRYRLRVRTRARAAVATVWFKGVDWLHVPGTAQLTASPLFDHDWYAAQAGCASTRRAAVQHYLTVGHEQGLSPHPLFDPSYFVAQLREDQRDGVPFLLFLRRVRWRLSPGPLFDGRFYTEAHPAASEHPHGLLGHYHEHAPSGARPNAWYQPGAGRPADLTDWARARQREWQDRRRTPAAAEPAPPVPAATASTAGTVSASVVVVAGSDGAATTRTVETVWGCAGTTGTRPEVIVVGDDLPLSATIAADALPLRWPGTRVLHHTNGRAPARCANLATAHATGDVVVFLTSGVQVRPGWLEALLDMLAEPDTVAAAPVLLQDDGTIAAAGCVFAGAGGFPYPFLHRFPAEDATAAAELDFAALTGAALAVRRSDLVAAGGFDADYTDGVEAIELSLRLGQQRPGRCRVATAATALAGAAVAWPLESLPAAASRQRLLDRWGPGLPEDAPQLWAAAGFQLAGHATPFPDDMPRRAYPPTPVLARTAQATVDEATPRLRWAIKNPSPASAAGDLWGDTFFAAAIARALRRLGQQVVIDRAQAFHRPTGVHDEVVLVLRGLRPYRPAFGQVNLMWLISHPELIERSEVAEYDRVFAASRTWADQMSRQWELPIGTLLQATDPGLFHPDLAEPDTGATVLFVGGSRNEHRPIIVGAAERGLDLSVYGTRWSDRIPERYIKGTSLPNDQVGAAYRAAGIVLNDHWEPMRLAGFISNRLFDAAAAGARIISDEVPGLDDLFGRSVQTVATIDDLEALARHPDLDAIFGNDEERRKVAARIGSDHSFDARARQLLDAALCVRGARGAQTGRPNPGA